MIDRYIQLNRFIRRIYRACQEGIDADVFQADGYAQATIADFLRRDIRELRRIWPEDLGRNEIDQLQQLATNPDHHALRAIMNEVLVDLEDRLDDHFGARSTGTVALEVIDLLHPRVFEASYGLFRAGRYRDAVLNGIVVVFDMIRGKRSVGQ